MYRYNIKSYSKILTKIAYATNLTNIFFYQNIRKTDIENQQSYFKEPYTKYS